MLITLRVPVTHAGDLYDQRQSRSDLLTDSFLRKIQITHRHHRLKSSHSVASSISMNGRHRAFVAGVHRLQHVKRLFAADFTKNDAVGTHYEGY